MERLFPFGLTTEAPVALPVDSWERAARVVHEQYRLGLEREGRADPSQPAQRPWDQLESFHKETNIRQVTTALSAAEQAGRSWGPVTDAQGRDRRGIAHRRPSWTNWPGSSTSRGGST